MKSLETIMPTDYPNHNDKVRFLDLGLGIDRYGRPLHPWRDRLGELPEGKGFFYEYGPNYTVDPIVISSGDTPKILLIRRGDNGCWALPGGFIDGSEHALEAGRRETLEETHIDLGDIQPKYIYSGPVDDNRATLHAWPETTALLWRVERCDGPTADDDAAEASWVPLSKLRQLDGFHGSHAALIEMAIQEHGTLADRLEYFGNNDFSSAQGGHMGYDRVVATLSTGERVFIKRHNPAHFTDPKRDEHSRSYLRKEHHVYQTLNGQTPYIPRNVELRGDHTLLLEAYDPRDGWVWRAPANPEARSWYIESVLQAINELENIPYKSFDAVNPSYPSIEHEGWVSYPKFRGEVIAKLRKSRHKDSDSLADVLDDLYRQAQETPTPELTHFAHFDMRQSNLAWHPEHGVRIVDWSWADYAPRGFDKTSFLIDIFKSGYDVTEYMDHFNKTHALTLIGFWLGHSTWPTPTPDQTIREHQLASALAAYKLIESFSEQG